MNTHVDDRIVAYLDGELPDAEIARVSAHVEACERCARLLRETRTAAQMIESDEATPPLTAMWPAVESRLGRRLPVFDLPFATATAAALAVGVMLGVLTFERQVQEIATVAEIATAADVWSIENELLLSDIYLSDPDGETNAQ